ncbi:Dymeclin [Heracleum sosnowskyi]|uniref:Dymeclin n=1 Tax=Heracleum sosnowskyi TaxID=360622 RepID=A0AAD8N427_9APIA|nr:Dymeclin [Heracleum sosnowskyi]
MGGVASTPRWSSNAQQQQHTAEYLIGAFIGDISFPINSEYWQHLLLLPFDHHWPSHRYHQACLIFAQNNCFTRHLAKILIHLAWCLQALVGTSGVQSEALTKAVNALHISSVFLQYLIENAKGNTNEELYLSMDDSESLPDNFPRDQSIAHFVMDSVLSCIGLVDVSSDTYLLHHGLLNFMLVAMSTQLLSGPSPGPDDSHPFTDAAMVQKKDVINLAVRRLLLNYIARSQFPSTIASYAIFAEGNQPGVLQRVGSAAANLVLLPLSFIVSSSGEASRSLVAESSLNILLILIHFRKCVVPEPGKLEFDGNAKSDSLLKEQTYSFENPYCKALENARDVEFDHADIERNARGGPSIPFASLFDTLGMSLADEGAVLILYSLIHGNADFLEYVLVRTDLETMLIPLLEILYNAASSRSNQIYMVLIILLILSQDSSFNASIHKLILPTVPWYKERILSQTSLGSLVVIFLARTLKYNQSELRDVYLHTNCLAILANMAPHVHHLSAYASQQLVSLFDMLSRRYTKLAELKNDKMHTFNGESKDGDSLPDDMQSSELHVYTDFLRIVLEILNVILTYALPRNPEVVYAILQRQEKFLPFKSHPRFNELLENIFTVLDFFNSRIDAHKLEGEWSVEKVLEVIIFNCRSWRGEGIKMFTQLRFTYEQESHPEEFFIPYVWQLVMKRSGYRFNPKSINLFPVDNPVEISYVSQEAAKDENNGSDNEVQLDQVV